MSRSGQQATMIVPRPRQRTNAVRGYVQFLGASLGPDDQVELVFHLEGSTKWRRIRIRALPKDQAQRLYTGLGMVLDE